MPVTKRGKVRRVPLAPELPAELRGRVGRLVPFRHADHFAKRIRHVTGVDGSQVHQLWHTFACKWLEDGRNLSVLQALRGTLPS